MGRHAGWLVAVAFVAAGCASDPPPRAAPLVTSTPAAAPSAPVGSATASPAPDPPPARERWRTERWHDVVVEVPSTWWYGASPVRLPQYDDVWHCGWGAMVSPDGRTPSAQAAVLRVQPGYVGRPVVLTETCESVQQGSDTSVPVEPYLWFDSPFPVGVNRLPEGWVEQTWEVGGTVLTIATRDDAVREHVVTSARTGGGACPVERDDLADPLTPPGVLDAPGSWVCAYSTEGRTHRLTWAAALTEEQAAGLVAAYDAAPAWVPRGRGCDLGGPGSEQVVLHAGAATYVVHPAWFGCPLVAGEAGVVELDPALDAAWRVGGVAAVIPVPLD